MLYTERIKTFIGTVPYLRAGSGDSEGHLFLESHWSVVGTRETHFSCVFGQDYQMFTKNKFLGDVHLFFWQPRTSN